MQRLDNMPSQRIVAIIGSRTKNEQDALVVKQMVAKVMKSLDKHTIYISGGAASGADFWCQYYCKVHRLRYIEAPAFWYRPVSQYRPGSTVADKSAGPFRNETIAQVCTDAFIFWDGKSPGTKSAIELLKLYEKPYVIDHFTPYVHPADQIERPSKPPAKCWKCEGSGIVADPHTEYATMACDACRKS